MSIFRPKNDPDTRAALEELRLQTRTYGRPLTAEERRMLSEGRAEDVEATIRAEREEREAESRRIAERRARVAARIVRRADAPPDYVPGGRLDLDRRASKDQSYSQGVIVVGKPEAPEVVTVDADGFNLTGSRWVDVLFAPGCRLDQVDFSDAVFQRVRFAAGCTLRSASFARCRFIDVEFDDGADICWATFDFCHFDDKTRIEFDRNSVRAVQFASGRRDRWWRLSRSYSGIWQFISIALSGAYLLLLAAKLYAFGWLASLQDQSGEWIRASREAGMGFREISAWEFLFGGALWPVMVAVLVLAYQVLRIVVTTRVGPMIDDELRGGFTPERTRVRALVTLDRTVMALGWFVLANVAVEVVRLLGMGLLVPA